MKIFRNLVITLGLVILLFVGLVYYSFSRTIPLKQGQLLSGGAVQVKDGMVSVGMIPSGPGQVVLIDCGNDPKAAAILAELKQKNLDVEAVKAIFLTHGHPDHVAGCRVFPQAGVYAMVPEQGLLEGKEAAKSPIGKLMGKKNSGIPNSKYLQDGETVQCGDLKVTAYLIPGHTDGSAAYLAAGTLYMGDSADAGKDGELLPAKHIVSNDTEQNRTSLKKLAAELKPKETEIQYMEFAHSGPLPGIKPLLEFAGLH